MSELGTAPHDVIKPDIIGPRALGPRLMVAACGPARVANLPKRSLATKPRRTLPNQRLYMPGRHPPMIDGIEGRMSHLHQPPLGKAWQPSKAHTSQHQLHEHSRASSTSAPGTL
jgi:hypothetical protein